VFGKHGYNGVHACKGGQVSEGVACFWKTDRFKLIEHERAVIGETINEKEPFQDFKDKLSENKEFSGNWTFFTGLVLLNNFIVIIQK